ncbi:MAG: hypothetical protein P1S59_01795 [bacterium]|nr:hypothetical protein [bacterium]
MMRAEVENHLAESSRLIACSDGLRNEQDGGLVQEEVVRSRTKPGFNSPIVDWMQGLLSECFLDLLASADFKTCALVDPVSTREKILQLTSGRSFSFADAQGAWEGLSPYMWERSLEKNAVPPGAGAVQGEKP